MMNINANLVAEPIFSSFEKDGETVEVVNFVLVKKYGKGKEYINCAAYGEKVETAKDFEKAILFISLDILKIVEKTARLTKLYSEVIQQN